MRRKSSSPDKKLKPVQRASRTAAFLWDESFLWGIMAWQALHEAGLPFDLVSAGDIRKGCLYQYAMLFVPGGWSSNKMKALGDEGVESIREFVRNGGNYLGFCGGAGLATLDGIGLLNIKRKPTKQRVPSFSGRIRLNSGDHAVWKGIHDPVFSAWWPPQFDGLGDTAQIVASYQKAMPDSFSSDLNVGDVEANSTWPEHEDIYRINLDPSRLYNEPALIEGSYGKGKVLLSLIHFDTPDDQNARIVLRNLWNYLSRAGTHSSSGIADHKSREDGNMPVDQQIVSLLNELEAAVTDLIDFGIRNFLWFWRGPLLLQWRRGVRGLEYNTLYVMVQTIADLFRQQQVPHAEKQLHDMKKRIIPFVNKAKQLLIRERVAMQQGHITFEECQDAEIQTLRAELFSSSKSYGGLFREIIGEIDNVLYGLLQDYDNGSKNACSEIRGNR